MENKKRKKGFSRLLQIAGKKKWLLTASSILAVIHSILSIIPYILVYYILSELLKQQLNQDEIWSLIIYSVLSVATAALVMYVSIVLSHIAAFNILYELRRKLSEKISKLPLGFLNQKSSGALKKIISDDIEKIELFIAHQLPDLIKGISLPVLVLIYLFTQNWILAVVSLIPVPVGMGLIIYSFKVYGEKERKQYFDSQEEMNGIIVEYIRGIPVVKIFNQTVESYKKYSETIFRFRDFVNDWIKRTSLPFSIWMSFMSNSLVLILSVGLYLYFGNSTTLPVLLLFFILGVGYLKPLFVLSNIGSQMYLISEGVDRIDKILYHPELPETEKSVKVSEFDIEFKNVSFAYDEKNNVLTDINIKIPQKSITALVGPSGAGKTTIARLIPRFWDVTSGAISIGGINIKSLKTDDLMEYVSFVFQENFMFQETIYENIRMGMDKTPEEIYAAAIAAQCHEFIINLPEKYNTKFGESGIHLSGGEQQRIQLARAILKDAPIIILDEATAFADPENELKIQQAFSKLIKDKTVIIIAHRLSTITDSEQIIVFDKGKINSAGTHKDLLEKSELYKNMWMAHTQAENFLIKENSPVKQYQR